MITTVRYADEVVGSYTLHRRPVKQRQVGWQTLAPGQGEDGYGKKITTDIMLRFNSHRRMYRVYCICFSNAGSNYITYKGQTLYLKTHFQSEVLDD